MATHTGSPFSLSHCHDTIREPTTSINVWVVDFLLRNENPNWELAITLAKNPKIWLPPIAIDANHLERIAGPGRKHHEDERIWNSRLQRIQRSITDIEDLPPIIVFARNGTDDEHNFSFLVADGAHRMEALREMGQTHIWSLVGFDSRQSRDRFLKKAM